MRRLLVSLGLLMAVALVAVGCGNSGKNATGQSTSSTSKDNVALTAVCDIWNQRREAAAERIGQWAGREPASCRTMAEICDRRDVDALVIAAADFQHAPLTRQAVEAGKDVYVEKPFGCDFEQIKLARDAVKKTGQIVQLGTQRRSHGVPWAARDFVKAGRLGKVTYVEMTNALFQQRWLLWVFVLAVLPALLANQAGWVAAEVGRQPWIVHPPVPRDSDGHLAVNADGVVEYDEVQGLRTAEATSPAVSREQVIVSIALFGLVYLLLAFVWIFILNKKIHDGPEPPRLAEETGTSGPLLDVATRRASRQDSLTASREEKEEPWT